MDIKEKPCKKEGDLFVACVEVKKFVSPCIDLILAWDKCMSREKLTDATVNLKLDTKPK